MKSSDRENASPHLANTQVITNINCQFPLALHVLLAFNQYSYSCLSEAMQAKHEYVYVNTMVVDLTIAGLVLEITL